MVRLYEYKNSSDDRVSLGFGRPVLRVAETNLCEEEEKEIPLNGQNIEFSIGCFEVKTFKVYY